MSATKKVTLYFPTLHLLWKFAQGLECKAVEIHSGHRTLFCECTEEEIEKAKKDYLAVLFQRKEMINH